MMDPKMEGMVRHILTAVGACLVYAGYLDGDAAMTAWVGGAMTVVGFMWSWMTK